MPNPESAASGFTLAWAAILLVVALGALYFQLSLPGKLATEKAYREAAAVLASEGKEGDVVLLYPWWTERARLFVPKAIPVVGYLGLDGDPLSAYSRIWVLAQPRLPRSDLGGFERRFLPGRAPIGSTRHFGNLQLSLYRNGLHRPIVFSAVSESASARVYLEQGDHARLDCPFDGKAHRCPGNETLHVAPEWHEVLYQPRFCLWMHPRGGSRRIAAEFPQARWGERLTLAAGIIGELAFHHEPELTPTQVVVEEMASGQRLLEIIIPPGREGIVQDSRPTTGAVRDPVGLRLWVQSENPALRETCVELFSDRADTP
ncbi:MAG TPA: hypothetical protein VN918_11580 [Myxococcaceae bacterium]|nr:hypothetical protein [Myxococcaceae bacterium]